MPSRSGAPLQSIARPARLLAGASPPRKATLSWGSLASSVLTRAGSATLVRHALFILGLPAAFRGTAPFAWIMRFSRRPRGPRGVPLSTHPLVTLFPLQRASSPWLLTVRAPSPVARKPPATDSPEVPLPPARVSSRSSLSPGLPPPVRSASRVPPPLGGLHLRGPTGLVSCRSARGISTPPERFPSAEPWRLFIGARCPPAVGSHRRAWAPERTAKARLQGVAPRGSPLPSSG